MLISRALAGHGVVSTGGAGGTALLIILAVGIAAFLVYLGQKKWRGRGRVRGPDGDDRSRDL